MEAKVIIYCMLFIGYAVYAYNRKSVSLVLPKLLEEGFDKSELGSIISSQNVAYAISKFLGGVLSDKLSAKLLFSSGTYCKWPNNSDIFKFFICFSICFAVVFKWFGPRLWMACMCQIVKKEDRAKYSQCLVQWFTSKHFATLWSTLSSSANISGGLSPFIATILTLQYGWRFSLIVAGAVSISSGVLAFFILSDSPSDENLDNTSHSKISLKADAQSKRKGTPSNLKGAFYSEQSETLSALLKSPFLWLVSLSYLVVFCAKTSAVDWGQLYLLEDRKQSQYAASAFTSSVESGGFFGGVLAGYLTDWVLKRRSSEQISSSKGNLRMDVAVYFMAASVGFLHLLQFSVNETSSQLWIATLGFMLGVCFYGPIAIYGVVASENAPAHLSGTAHAIVALAANVGAIISGLPFSYIAEFYSWSSIFFILEMMSGVMVFTMLLCRNMNSSMGKIKKE